MRGLMKAMLMQLYCRRLLSREATQRIYNLFRLATA